MKITVVIELKQNPNGYDADPTETYMKAKLALGKALQTLQEDDDVLVSGSIEPQRFRGDKIDWSLGDAE